MSGKYVTNEENRDSSVCRRLTVQQLNQLYDGNSFGKSLVNVIQVYFTYLLKTFLLLNI